VVNVNKKQHYDQTTTTPQHTASGMTEALATKAAEAAFENSQLKTKSHPPGKRKIASRKSRSMRHSPAEAHSLAPKTF
jgi:hypothetical protein